MDCDLGRAEYARARNLFVRRKKLAGDDRDDSRSAYHNPQRPDVMGALNRHRDCDCIDVASSAGLFERCIVANADRTRGRCANAGRIANRNPVRNSCSRTIDSNATGQGSHKTYRPQVPSGTRYAGLCRTRQHQCDPGQFATEQARSRHRDNGRLATGGSRERDRRFHTGQITRIDLPPPLIAVASASSWSVVTTTAAILAVTSAARDLTSSKTLKPHKGFDDQETGVIVAPMFTVLAL